MITFKDINYIRYGNNKNRTIVMLHGWGQNIEMMKFIGDRLDEDVLILDLPGFGKSKEPDEVISIYDYADLVHDLVLSLKIDNVILIGHSFGGKIALAYASKYKVEKLVLLASPFRGKENKTNTKTKILKGLKKVPGLNKLEEFAKKHIGSTDYKNASGIMREILVKHVNLDITEDVKKITCPTLIIWGDNDEAVPISDGEVLEKLIKDSGLIVFSGCTHYAYLERLDQLIRILNEFFK